MLIKEEDIRPHKIFSQYLRLAERDAALILKEAQLEQVNCVVCGQLGTLKYEKIGFSYSECPDCLTIFCNPRPSYQDLTKFYTQGESTKFWATDFYRVTAEARRQKLWRPTAMRVLDIMQSSSKKYTWLCDIGGGYGIFADEFRTACNEQYNISVLEPSEYLANECKARGLVVKQKFLEEATKDDFPDCPGVITSFELFEHLHNPRAFLKSLFDNVPSGSKVLLTTLSGLGIDIRLLGVNSKSVFPPHHLNFANPFSIRKLCESVGFVDLNVFTPGELDIDILSRSLRFIDSDFWHAFFKTASEPAKYMIQRAIADSGYSSHMWVVANKP